MSEEGKTIICTTHDLEAIVSGKGNIVALKQGKIVLEGKESMKAHRLFEEVY